MVGWSRLVSGRRDLKVSKNIWHFDYSGMRFVCLFVFGNTPHNSSAEVAL